LLEWLDEKGTATYNEVHLQDRPEQQLRLVVDIEEVKLFDATHDQICFVRIRKGELANTEFFYRENQLVTYHVNLQGGFYT
jgi:hypothetical protein